MPQTDCQLQFDMSKSKRKHGSDRSTSDKRRSEKSRLEKPSKCRQRLGEAVVELRAELDQNREDLERETGNRIKELEAKIESLQKQNKAAIAKIKQMETKDKVRDRVVAVQQTKIERLCQKLELTGPYPEYGSPELIHQSSFMAVTPTTPRNGNETSEIVMEMPGIRAFTTKTEGNSQQLFIVDVDRQSVNPEILFQAEDHQIDGDLANERNSQECRINSWINSNDPSDADPLSLFLEDEPQAGPLDGSLVDVDYHRSVSEDEHGHDDGPPVRVPLKTANSVKKERMVKSKTTGTQKKDLIVMPVGQKSVTVEGIRTWKGTKKCYICRSSTRRICANERCQLPVCGKESGNRNYCNNYDPALGACFRIVDGQRKYIKHAEDICSQVVNMKRVFVKKSNKRASAPEQGRCVECKVTHKRTDQKISRSRCDCCYHFYCRDHRHEPVVECIKHRDETPTAFATDSEVEAPSLADGYNGYRSDAMSSFRSPSKRLKAVSGRSSSSKRRHDAETSSYSRRRHATPRSPSPNRRYSTSSASSNSSTPMERSKLDYPPSPILTPGSLQIPKELQRHSYMLTRFNYTYGL